MGSEVEKKTRRLMAANSICRYDIAAHTGFSIDVTGELFLGLFESHWPNCDVQVFRSPSAPLYSGAKQWNKMK